MTPFLRLLTVAGLAAALALPAVALAAEPENYEADARQAGGIPPTIPHKVGDDAEGHFCNSCHKEGIKGAPQTSHPERLGCTQCHVPGEVKAKKGAKKAKAKK